MYRLVIPTYTKVSRRKTTNYSITRVEILLTLYWIGASNNENLIFSSQAAVCHLYSYYIRVRSMFLVYLTLLGTCISKQSHSYFFSPMKCPSKCFEIYQTYGNHTLVIFVIKKFWCGISVARMLSTYPARYVFCDGRFEKVCSSS